MRSFFFLTLLTGVTLIEIFLFIQASSYINILTILAITICTALIGISLAKKQVISALSDVSHSGNTTRVFLDRIVDGVGALSAGFLLLLPGFCTDLIGVLLLCPPLRRVLLLFGLQYLLDRTRTYYSNKNQTFNKTNDTIIEGEFKSSPDREDTDKTKPLR